MIIRLVAAIPLESGLAGLKPEVGPGSVVLCSPQPLAVATAQRLYPDRRIEVKNLYQAPHTARRGPLALWLWLWRPLAGDEAVETARRRVVDSVIRLVQVAKEQQEATLVGDPLFLRLLALKLNSIGYRGPMFAGFKAGQTAQYRYTV